VAPLPHRGTATFIIGSRLFKRYRIPKRRMTTTVPQRLVPPRRLVLRNGLAGPVLITDPLCCMASRYSQSLL